MFSSPITINNHVYHDTSSSSSSCSNLDNSPEEFILLNNNSSQKQHEYIADEQNDSLYWTQRSKNNLSTKQSRIKRRMHDLVLETKLTQLTNENEILRAKIDMLTRKFHHLNDQEDEHVKHDEFKLTEQSIVVNLLDQSSKEINHRDKSSVVTTKKEHLSTVPIKWRFKMLNITSDF